MCANTKTAGSICWRSHRPGGLGASWGRFTGFVHGELTLKTLDRLRYAALGAMLVIVFFTMANVILPALQRDDAVAMAEASNWLFFYVFLIPMMYFDYLYAVVSGGLLSILVPALYPTDARVIAIIAGVVLHFTGYLMAALTGGVMLPAIYATIGFQGWVADLSRALGALMMFVLVHETLALLLYRAAQERLNGDDLALIGQV